VYVGKVDGDVFAFGGVHNSPEEIPVSPVATKRMGSIYYLLYSIFNGAAYYLLRGIPLVLDKWGVCRVGEECTIGSVATAISFMKEGCCLEEGF
jgi:hypothetical protein